MSKELVQIDLAQSLVALEGTQKLCEQLMRTPHYAKLGREGIFAVVAKARSLNVDPLDALNGGLYCVQGKVEMSSQMMNHLIRMHGHSISKDDRSDDNICILKGKRADNGDTWIESFSIQEAKRAGIYKEAGSWGKYPRDMLFARALSRLARQLFPDVIKGCYVQGEIQIDASYEHRIPVETPVEVVETTITAAEAQELERLFCAVPAYRETVTNFLLEHHNVDAFAKLPASMYERIYSAVSKKVEDLKAAKSPAKEQEVTLEVSVEE